MEELRFCKKGITGADAAVIMGQSPYISQRALFLDKTDSGVRLDKNPQSRWGELISEIISAEFSRHTGSVLRRKNAILCSKEHKFMIASVDRILVGKNEGLKCKLTMERNAKFYKNGATPPHLYVQAQHYMAVTGFKAFNFAVLAGARQLFIRRFTRDEGYINKLIDRECRFWQMVRCGVFNQDALLS